MASTDIELLSSNNLRTNFLHCWWSGVVVSALASINEVNQRRARLVLRWVTVSGFISRWGTFISVCDQPPRSTQPGHPFVGRCNEYQPKGSDVLRLGSKGRYMVRVWVAGKTVWSPCYTRAISERFRDKELIIKRYINSLSLLFTFTFYTLTSVRSRRCRPVNLPLDAAFLYRLHR